MDGVVATRCVQALRFGGSASLLSSSRASSASSSWWMGGAASRGSHWRRIHRPSRDGGWWRPSSRWWGAPVACNARRPTGTPVLRLEELQGRGRGGAGWRRGLGRRWPIGGAAAMGDLKLSELSFKLKKTVGHGWQERRQPCLLFRVLQQRRQLQKQPEDSSNCCGVSGAR
ncbi:uncharacterized protein [Lolium perenne]|uniref:uncharacterized protein n=1 Tax=Lolium perenne TaxID=4522 RepID=UPI003A99D808